MQKLQTHELPVRGAAFAASDFNGDGYADLAIGSPDALVNHLFSSGTVTVVSGSTLGLDPEARRSWSQESTDMLGEYEDNDDFGGALTIGDYNGDGRSDLAIGVVGERVGSKARAGAVAILYAGANGLLTKGNQLWSLDSEGIRGVAKAVDLFGGVLA
jgi:hypothetical protein